MVVHSTTKYLNGHSDVIGGIAIVGDNPDLPERLGFLQNSVGAIAGPFDAFLTLRGVKTLALRMERHCANALALAQWLERQPQVARVYYPGLPSHPQHELAKRQMRGFGGMISLDLRCDLAGARRFLENVRIFSLAESLGGVESLIEHPAIMTHASIPAETRADLGIGDSLIRLSVGVGRWRTCRPTWRRRWRRSEAPQGAAPTGAAAGHRVFPASMPRWITLRVIRPAVEAGWWQRLG